MTVLGHDSLAVILHGGNNDDEYVLDPSFCILAFLLVHHMHNLRHNLEHHSHYQPLLPEMLQPLVSEIHLIPQYLLTLPKL